MGEATAEEKKKALQEAVANEIVIFLEENREVIIKRARKRLKVCEK